jgi:hypothetical protein|tara:strand:+ start:898 stop:1329 length:432 start_codon:yes stop_codon:yes gene_type:complete
MLGTLLQGREMQYIASKDTTTNTWRILDTWHDELKTMGAEDEIPDDCAAVTILTEGEFIALIKEASRLGVLENASFASDDTGLEDESNTQVSEIQEELVKYKEENSLLKQKLQDTEPYRLKTKAMEAVLKLAALSDINHLSEE